MFALQIRLSISLFRLPSLVSTTPRHMELLHMLQCIVAYLQCALHALGVWRDNTSVLSVLIFLHAWSHAAENRSSSVEDPGQKMQAVPNHLQKANNWSCSFQLLSIPVVPNLFRCIPPFAHFRTFHSSLMTQNFFYSSPITRVCRNIWFSKIFFLTCFLPVTV